ncbi:MAG: hypothetical protein AB1578_06795 [Thermodesulfobacteriota bacterium]
MNPSPQLTLAPRIEKGTLTPRTGGPVSFERVVLELRNLGAAPATGLRLRLSARQGADTICELDEPLEAGLAPGAAQAWDLYDLFLAKGRGFPSKVRLFGVKAALEWDFSVEASAASGGAGAEAAFRFRWSGPVAGPITVSLTRP